MYSQFNLPSVLFLLACTLTTTGTAATAVTKPGQPAVELLETAPEITKSSAETDLTNRQQPTLETTSKIAGSCTAGVGKLYGASTHFYTLANMKNWTNEYLGIAFTNVNHTEIDSFRVHTTSRTTSYYNGNGGTFKFHIYSDDGSGKPDELLASTPDYIGATSLKSTGGPWSSQSQAESTYPDAIWSSYGETGKELVYHRRFNLTAPLSVTPGVRYHIVMKRTSTASHGTSLNGFFSGRLDKDDDRFFNKGDWVIHVSSTGKSGTWDEITHRGIFEVYGNGMVIGNAQHEVNAFSDTDKANNLNGSSAARQVWVPHKNMEIARVRVQAGRRSGSAPIHYQIKNSSDTVLRSGSITDFPTLSGNDARAISRNMGRRSADFEPLSIVAGQTYYIEFSTDSGSHYEIGMTRDGVLSGYYNVNPDYHGWGAKSRAEVSYDNGATWKLPTNWNSEKNYLAVEADVGEYANGDITCLESQNLKSGD